jgi:hypothetical protein
MPVQLPPPAGPAIESARPQGTAYTPVVQLPPPQQPVQIPGPDFVVEVIGNLPLQIKVENLARLLSVRARTKPVNRLAYPTTMLELITLVERNPEKPRGKDWTSIPALSMRFDAVTGHVSVEYCVEYCDHNPRTGAFNPKRRLVYYHAPEAEVIKRADKKLASLKKYAAVPGPP